MKKHLLLLLMIFLAWLPGQLWAQTQTHIWDFNGQVVNNWIDGWTITNYNPAVAEEGILKLHGTKTNNLIRYDVPAGTINPQETNVAVIRLKNTTIHTKARFYWWTLDPQVDAAYIEFNISANDTEFKEYAVDLSNDPRWAGTIRIIRFDIPASLSMGEFGKPIYVDNVRLYSDYEVPEDPNAQYTHVWEFNEQVSGTTVERWNIVNYANPVTANGILTLTGIMTNNNLRHDVWANETLDAGRSITAVIRLKNETPETVARFYWWTIDPNSTPSYVEFDITPNDTEFKEYRINLISHPDWIGNIRIIRFDIPASLQEAYYGSKIHIDYIKLSTKEAEVPEEEPLTPMPARWPAPFGVNLSGAEFGDEMPGVLGTHYGYPTKAELDYFKAKGLTLIRFPFKWERVQHELGGPLNMDEIHRMKAFMDEARKRNMWIILDMHNYARRKIGEETHIIGSATVSVEHVTDAWRKLAQTFKSYENLWGYGIMNEPHDQLASMPWFTIAQTIINGIREVDTQTPIIVGGDSWSSAFRWQSASDNLKNLQDPSKNLVFEAHQYFDKNHGGGYPTGYDSEGASPTVGVERLTPFVNWLKTNKLRGFIGEYGVPDDDPRWLVTLDNTLRFMSENCMGGTYWAAGPRWGNYKLSVEPKGGVDRPQMAILEKYKFASGSCAAVLSVREENFGRNWAAYPNPVQGLLHITLDKTYAQGTVQVLGVQGNKVLEKEIKGASQFTLNMTALPAGIYLVRVIAGQETSVVRVVKL